jgi:hypothetical protein
MSPRPDTTFGRFNYAAACRKSIFGMRTVTVPEVAFNSSGHAGRGPLLGVKRTCHFALQMSAFDPKRTLAVRCAAMDLMPVLAPT